MTQPGAQRLTRARRRFRAPRGRVIGWPRAAPRSP